jgi:assimilatory nitrate reductase catalytic subunit
MTRSGTVARLFGHVPEPVAEMHPQDMARRGFVPGELVRICSRHGEIVLPLAASDALGLGQISVPMHWGSAFVGGQSTQGAPLAGINALTTPRCCPSSSQPELKHAAVRIEPAQLPWHLLGMAWLPPERLAEAHAALVARLPHFGYAACVPFGRERSGLLFRAALAQALDSADLADLQALLGLDGADALHYHDRASGQYRAARLTREPTGAATEQRTLEGFLLAGDTRAETWLRSVLENQLPAQAYGRLLLAPGAQAPDAVAGRSPQVCTCFNVSEADIGRCLAGCSGDAAARLAMLQAQLRCGTNCGSCIPALRRLVNRSQPATVAA